MSEAAGNDNGSGTLLEAFSTVRTQAFRTLSPLVFGHAAAMTLQTAIELNLPDIIAKAGPEGALSLRDLSAQLPSDSVDEQALQRVMRALVHYGIFFAKQDTELGKVSVRYGLTPASKMLVKESSAGSMAQTASLLNNKAAQEPWHHLQDSILYGKNAFVAAHGKDYWEYSKFDHEYKVLFEAMLASNSTQMQRALMKYQGFKDVEILVDAGGYKGEMVASVVAEYPHIHGINMDLPHVVAEAPIYPGVEHVGGSLVTDQIPSGDAILLKNVLHCFEDERCIKILQNCRRALPSDGKLLVFDPVIPSEFEGSESPYHSVSPEMDLILMVYSGGVDRTEEQWRNILADGGFTKANFISLLPPQFWLIEAYP